MTMAAMEGMPHLLHLASRFLKRCQCWCQARMCIQLPVQRQQKCPPVPLKIGESSCTLL